MRKVLIFDLDSPWSWHIPDEVGLPEPSCIVVSPGTGRAHVAYFLDTPVSFFEKSRQAPIEYYKDIEVGFRNRMQADAGFSGLMMKNPFHERFETDWQAVRRYPLGELRDSLDKQDIRRARMKVSESAIGRNCTVFDTIREVAYKQVRILKKAGKPIDALMEIMIRAAMDVNSSFPLKLTHNELLCTARSVTRWTWRKFTLEKFSAIQMARSHRRLNGAVPLSTLQPWATQGISRSLWFARRAANPGYPDMGSPEQVPQRTGTLILPET